MRQYGEVPPWLSPAVAPAVSATTGLGTGGGAGVQTPDGQGFGSIIVAAGPDAAVGGSITLVYATTPPTMFYAASDAFGTLTVTGQGTTTHTLTWTAKPSNRSDHLISYEWATSQ